MISKVSTNISQATKIPKLSQTFLVLSKKSVIEMCDKCGADWPKQISYCSKMSAAEDISRHCIIWRPDYAMKHFWSFPSSDFSQIYLLWSFCVAVYIFGITGFRRRFQGTTEFTHHQATCLWPFPRLGVRVQQIFLWPTKFKSQKETATPCIFINVSLAMRDSPFVKKQAAELGLMQKFGTVSRRVCTRNIH